MRDIRTPSLSAIEELAFYLEIVDGIQAQQAPTTVEDQGPYRPLVVQVPSTKCTHDLSLRDEAFRIAREVVAGAFEASLEANVQRLWKPWEYFCRIKPPTPEDGLCYLATALCRVTYEGVYDHAREYGLPDVCNALAEDYDDIVRPITLRCLWATKYGKHIRACSDETILAAYAAQLAGELDLTCELLGLKPGNKEAAHVKFSALVREDATSA
jgi:hypothetical protein